MEFLLVIDHHPYDEQIMSFYYGQKVRVIH